MKAMEKFFKQILHHIIEELKHEFTINIVVIDLEDQSFYKYLNFTIYPAIGTIISMKEGHFLVSHIEIQDKHGKTCIVRGRFVKDLLTNNTQQNEKPTNPAADNDNQS